MDHQQSSDMATARSRNSFDPASLSPIFWPEGRRRTLDALVEILSKDPVFDKNTRRHLSRQEQLERGYAIQLRLVQLRKGHGWDDDTFMLALGLIDDHVPFGLHFSAFIPVLRSQGSDEQIAEWLPRCQSLEVIGCYAQTELGHGSNVQGLETTATFDRTDNMFEIHSPTLTSIKWWAGGLGTVANHAVVQAQMILMGENRGPHLFIVPLRDQKTHRPLPGVKLGDIGPKHYGGFSMNDNGFAKFSRVRIPLANLLCRYARVDEEGGYAPAGHPKIGYGSMVALRAGMPIVQGLELAKCVTIAIRYTTVRRQFTGDTTPAVTDKMEDGSAAETHGNDSGEMQVIRYSSVKDRLVPLLAASYCYLLTGHAIKALYERMLDALVRPPHDATLLAEVHLITSGLKAVLSWNVVAGMEEARKSLGGHGFSIYSGIGERFAKEVPGQTYEGDNYVLVQQTAKSLLKEARLLAKGQADRMMGSTRFLATLVTDKDKLKCSRSGRAGGEIDWSDHTTQLAILGLRVGGILESLGPRAQTEPWAELNMLCVRVTRAFVDHHVARTFRSEISRLAARVDVSIDARARAALNGLADIFCLDALTAAIPDLAEFGLLHTPTHDIRALRAARASAINAATGDLVGLTDAFGFTDWELNSVLGRADGRVYEGLWEAVNETNPVNTRAVDGVVAGFERYIMPLHQVASGAGYVHGGARL